MKDEEAGLYTDLIVSINTAMHLAWHQYRRKALSSIKHNGYKFRVPMRVKLSRKERQEKIMNDAVTILKERFEKLKNDVKITNKNTSKKV